LALARCHQALKNVNFEADAYIDAGEVLWEQEVLAKENDMLGFFESGAMATQCYLLAIKIYLNQKKFIVASTLYSEMASVFKQLGKYAEAADYFQQAAELQQSESPLTAIISLEEAVDCHIKLCDYKGSCTGLIWIIKLASEVINFQEEPKSLSTDQFNHSVYVKSLFHSRIFLILLLILQGDFQQSQDFVKKIVEDANSCNFEMDFSNNVVFMLDSLVMFCEQRNLEAVKSIHRELWRVLTPKQNDVLSLIQAQMIDHQKLAQLQ